MQSVSYSQVVMVRMCTTHNDLVGARSDVSFEAFGCVVDLTRSGYCIRF